jgi:sugar lactone lactonase YvrE
VITQDRNTLVVAESFGERLAAFDIDAMGKLSNRRIWAALPGVVPDGICLDAEGAVWVANPLARECLRVAEGGAILDRVETSAPCYACMLGGDDRTTLFLMTNTDDGPRHGRVETVDVDVPGVGWP